MANIENLIPIKERTTSEQREIAKMGGKKSGEIRKEKATFRKAIQWLINSDIKINDGDITKHFKKAGIDVTGLNPTQIATIGLWYGAIQGNSTNYKMLMELSGELQENPYIAKEPILNITITENNNLKQDFFKHEE